VYNQLKLYQYEKALYNLKKIEEIQEEYLVENSRQLEKTRELIGQVNYQLLKFPGPLELVVQTLTKTGLRNPLSNTVCECAITDVDELDLRQFAPRKPETCSKMSGHKVSYA